MKYEVLVEVRLRPGIADPQGATIERALPALGFEGIDGVGVGKAIRMSVEAPDEPTAREAALLEERVRAHVEGKDVQKFIYVKGKIVSFIVR